MTNLEAKNKNSAPSERQIYLYIIAILITIVGFFMSSFHTSVNKMSDQLIEIRERVIILESKL